MGFKTFTCVICGKEGITKPNSYAYGNGRACRCHQEVQEDFNKKKAIVEEREQQRRELSKMVEHPELIGQIDWKDLNDDPEANFMLNVYDVVKAIPFCMMEALELLEVKITEVREKQNPAMTYYVNAFSKEWLKWLIYTRNAGLRYRESAYLDFKNAVKRITDEYKTELNKVNGWDDETVISVYKKLFDYAFSEIGALNKKLLEERSDENFLAVKERLVALSKFWSIFNGSKFSTSEKVRGALAESFARLEKLLTAAS